MSTTPSPWLPQASCGEHCMRAGAAPSGGLLRVTLRVSRRAAALALLLPTMPILAIRLPGRVHVQRSYCRLLLRALGTRISVAGDPVRNLRGVLVVSDHVSWLDVFVVGAVLPGSFVAKAELLGWTGIGRLARLVRVIPIERANLRRLPEVVAAVASRLHGGHTVVAFPEGTTWCGLGHGTFRPALFQAAVDTGRPVQPLRLSYRHADGRTSTVPAYVGQDTLAASIRRLLVAQRTAVRVEIAPLQLPGTDRRELARRCETAVGRPVAAPVEHQRPVAA